MDLLFKIGMTSSFGVKYHYERTKVRVITVCPGLTVRTNIFIEDVSTFSPEYIGAWNAPVEELFSNKDIIQT